MYLCLYLVNVLFLTSDNEISWIIHSSFGSRHILTILSTKIVIKCATKFWKSVDKYKIYVQKIFLNTEFLVEKYKEKKKILKFHHNFREIAKFQ